VKLYRVRQKLVSNPLAEAAAETRRALDALRIEIPTGEVAITAGSRGIAHIDAIIRAAGDWLRDRGASPFIVPCMGSHNGATADGQRAMIESLGITEQAMGMEIRSNMEVVRIGSVSTGDVYMDRRCYESAGVLVVNRVKLHTCFSGPVQSGLSKMMVVGMGKIKSAETFHRSAPAGRKDMIAEMARVVLSSGKILAGLAILEDGYDETAEIHALCPEEIPSREPALLERHRRYFPRLPLEAVNVLVVGAIGKTYSGTGMDTNVIGYRGIKGFEDLSTPRINVIAALSLSPESQGNAIGVGLADFITRRLREEIDEKKTFINVFTTGDMERAKIPATLADDETLVEIIRGRFGESRWVFIRDTLHLDEFFVSEDIAGELSRDRACEVAREPIELGFADGRHTLPFRLAV
jgi:hypothetical protein